jgi:hypothetical protein
VQSVVSACSVSDLNVIAPSVRICSMIIRYIDANHCEILTAHRVK